MKNPGRLSWLLLAALGSAPALLVSPAVAETQEGSLARPQHRLKESETRSGVGIRVVGAELELWACSDEACARSSGALSYEIPADVAQKKPRVERLEGKGEQIWWIRFGGDDRFYSFVIAGAAKQPGASPGQPKVLLRGWAGSSADVKTKMFRKAKGGIEQLTVQSSQRSVACGRATPRVTRLVDPVSAKARRVKAPILTKEERGGAKVLTATSGAKIPSGYRIGLQGASAESAQTPIDGDRSEAWEGGFEWVELKAPAGADLKRLVIEVAGPQDKPVALYLATESEVFQLVLPAQKELDYWVEVPESTQGCLALIQPKSPAPVTEVMGFVNTDDPPTEDELIGELERGNGALALAALHVRGQRAGARLYDKYPELSSLGRRRALEFARRATPRHGAAVWIAGLLSDNESENQEALEGIRSIGSVGIQALEAALRGYKGERRPRLVAPLITLSSERAVVLFPRLFEGATPEMRAALRDAFSDLQEKQEKEVTDLVDRIASGKSDLSSEIQVEIARALAAVGPVLRTKNGHSWMAKLASDANFRDAYLLAPSVLSLAGTSDDLKRIYGDWLLGKGAGELSRIQQAALSTRLLEVLTDQELMNRKDAVPRFDGGVVSLLGAENPRVRRGALNASHFLKVQVPRQSAEKLLVKDEWPQVRGLAVRALVEGVEKPTEDQNLIKLLVRRLSKDEHHTVRRLVARHLSELPGPATLKALRRSYAKDESYAVKAEAAVSLGKLCDGESLDKLTQSARSLTTGLTDDGAIELGLSSVTALAHLAPRDLDQRLAPLLSDDMPGITRQQVKQRLESVKSSKSGAACKR